MFRSLGKTYAGILTRSGREESGPFTALAYEEGLLLVGNVEQNRFCVIDKDVVDDGEWIYTERISGVFSFHEPLEDLIAAGDVERIQLASQQKFFWRLSEAGARLFLKIAAAV